MVYLEGVELGWKSRVTERWLLTLGGYYEDGLAPDDSDDGYLEGIESRDDVISIFAEAKYAFDPQWRNWVAGRFLGGPSDFGYWAELTAGHRFSDSVDGTGTEAWLYLSLSNSDFVKRGFGVSAEDAMNTEFPETTLDGGFRSVGFFILDRRRLTDHIQLIAKFGCEYYSSEIQDSPIAQDDYKIEAGLVLLWQF